ncbi:MULTISPECIES: hypothetical protein [Cetobacterium]|uniref:Uncharacterized protein n=1 Tax=Candidatus Cetobacterium colombiensis TaxID=3073100 RepID=A0ABU4WDZ8_9FUSO|nr:MULTISPECIES: hypothetical protein [Cetobacterium]MDX8337385.1 hypothetical protein [Candidatus Cetobacterium colombiensis]WVJ03348.1 hypothetical protein VSU16_16095 [Cetobacterium somerae]
MVKKILSVVIPRFSDGPSTRTGFYKVIQKIDTKTFKLIEEN